LTTVRILADDLTGALDAAAPFATPANPVHLVLHNPLEVGKQTISSESREMGLDAARAAVRAAVEALRPGTEAGTLWFKKVDSVLRGWPVEETLELMRCLTVPYCVFAPAFPEMGRRTANGLHEVADPDRPGVWASAAIGDLRAAFEAAGAKVSMLRDGAADGILIGDAAEPGDLRSLVSHAPRRGVLWAGSRGLAEALCAPRTPIVAREVGTVVIGTTHPVTRRQIERLREIPASSNLRLIDPVPDADGPEKTLRCLHQEMAAMDHPAGKALVVVGGNTLTAVLSAIRAQSLACIGEIAPGLPVSTIAGGRFNGTMLVTKSGGFGDGDLLVRLCRPPAT
jgi:uncharacterized protein YgbK (DUF1537 family)